MKASRMLLCALAGAAALSVAAPAAAQDYYIGQIVPITNTYCPYGMLAADGSTYQISQYQALASLFGATFGGDGRTTFAMPNMPGRHPVGAGQGPGLQNYALGSTGGINPSTQGYTQTLTAGQIPSHTHSGTVVGVNALSDDDEPTGAALSNLVAPAYAGTTATPSVDMAAGTIVSQPAGQAQPVPYTFLPPYLTLRFCVVWDGGYPQRP